MFFPPLTIVASTGDDGEANSSRITLRGGKHTGGWRVGGISKNMGRPKSCVSIKLLSCTFWLGLRTKNEIVGDPKKFFLHFLWALGGWKGCSQGTRQLRTQWKRLERKEKMQFQHQVCKQNVIKLNGDGLLRKENTSRGHSS